MKKIVFTLLMAMAAVATYAQETYSSSGKPIDETKKKDGDEDKGFNPNNLIFGGGFNFGIGGGVTDLGLSPVIGYKFTERFSAGIGLGYEYLSIKDFKQYLDKSGIVRGYTLKSSIYSGSIWARYVLFQNVFVHVEPQMIFWNRVNSISYDVASDKIKEDKQNVFVPRVLVGGGLRQPVSDRVSFLVMALYDVIHDPNSPYNGFDIRFGVVAGF